MFSSSSSLVGNATPPESSPSLAAAAASPSPSPSQHSSTLSSSATVSLAGGTLVPSSTSTVPSSSPNTNITSSNSNEQLTQQQQQQQQSNQAISCSDSAALSQPVTSSTAEESPSPHSSSSAAAALLQRSHSLSSAFYRPELGGNSQQQQHILNNNDSSSGHRSQALSFSSGQTSLDQYFGSNQSPTIGTHCQSFISPQTPLFSVAAAVSVANCIVTNSNSNLNLSGSTSGHNISGPTAHRTSAVSSPAHSSSSGRATPTPTLTPLAPLAHFGPTQQQQQQQQQHHNTVQRHSSFSFQETPSFIGGGNSCSFNTQQQQQQQINSGSGLAPKRSFSNIYNGSTAPSIAKRSLVSHLQGHNTTAHASEGSDDSGFVSASSPTSGNLQQQQQQNSSTMMSTSPSLIGSGQYGHSDAISSAAVTATSYNFEDYSIPFSSGWTTLTNLDQATAAAMAAAAASQSPTALHHVSHTGLPLQMPPLQQSSLSSAAAAAISNNQQQQQQQQQSQQASPSGTSLGLSGQSLHSGNGQGLMALKDIKMFQNYPSKSATTNAEIRILKQPETHHRARYMTEGSRGTIKDRTGRGYPVVQLAGYNKGPVKLQCFIGHDQKIGEPHLFYQACEVSGKTPYTFVKIDGFNTIELELLPKNNMQAVFDCMGILKERNVDVERKVLRNRRRSQGSRPGVNATEEAKMIRNTNKSRSTHCRMVFRLILPDTGEILQCVSEQILCTQPLGSPEIYKMSLRECDLKGGAELFVIGKNFHKDTKVIFESVGSHWRKLVSPQKEFLNSTHLVCQVPPYDGLNVNCLPLINVDVSVHCNHKNSDPMKFIYTNGFSSGIGISANGKRSSLVSGDAFDCTNLNPWNNVSAAVSAATANNNDRRNSPDSMPTSHSAAAAAAAASAQAASTHPLVYFDPSQSQLAAAAAYLRETGNVVASPIMTGANNTNALFLLERSDVLK